MKTSTAQTASSASPAARTARAFADRQIAVLCGAENRTGIAPPNPSGRIVFAHRLVELVESLDGQANPILLLHAAALRESDVETARILRDLPCGPVVAVCGGKDHMDRAFWAAKRLGLAAILPDDCLHFPIELERWVGWIERDGPAPGLIPHLGEDAVIREIQVASKKDKPAAIAEILSFIGDIRSDAKFLFELRLILEETINNAIFHAFCDGVGRERYTIESFTSLADGESVNLNFGSNGHTIGVAVNDNQGRLRAETILSKIQRQLSTQGIFDQSGRGLYLVYSLAGRLIFNLRPDSLTQALTLYPVTAEAWTHASPRRSLLIFDHS